MKTIQITLGKLKNRIQVIGIAGENMRTRMVIDCSEVFDEYPEAVPTLAVQPHTGDAYPAIVERDGNNVIWNITSSETSSQGSGRGQLTFTEGSVVARNEEFGFSVLKAIIPNGSAPGPIANWLIHAAEMLNMLQEAYESGTFDGFSPEVSVEPIEGGHRVSITDKTHTETFDIMDAASVTILTPTGNTFTLLPCPTTYSFGEKSVLNVTVTRTTQYHFSFSSPLNTPCDLTINGAAGVSGSEIEAGKTYEVDVWNGIALIAEVEVAEVT